MAVRPWITPDEVRDYSNKQTVKDRSDSKLAVDIARAEAYIIKYTGNDFSNNKKYPHVPENIRLADILLSESYAAGASENISGGGNYKSETFDDYSYTVADSAFKVGNLDLSSLLDEFITAKPTGNILLRMRKL